MNPFRISNAHRYVAAVASVTALAAISLPVSADLALDPERSRVSLLSTKVVGDGTNSVTERFGFGELAGSVASNGAATVTIPLASVETGVDIRNERMAEFLFETATHPDATISANVPESAIANGEDLIDIDVSLDLHGNNGMITVPVNIDRDDDTVVVTAVEPVLLDAAAFELTGGLAKLAELAGLLHIPASVPVSFTLTFVDSES